MARAKMLLVEDDNALAELISYHFEREGFAVTRTANGEEALLLAREQTPDIMLLDWMLEGVSGIEVCRQLRRNPVDREHADHHADRARRGRGPDPRAGNRGRRLRDQAVFSPRELVARVMAVLRRVRPALAGEQLRYADIEMDTVGHKVRRGGETVALGPTEFRLLRHFLEHPGHVFSRERLLDAVWGHDSDIESRTVDVHIRRLRQAINPGRQGGRDPHRSLGRLRAGLRPAEPIRRRNEGKISRDRAFARRVPIPLNASIGREKMKALLLATAHDRRAVDRANDAAPTYAADSTDDGHGDDADRIGPADPASPRPAPPPPQTANTTAQDQAAAATDHPAAGRDQRRVPAAADGRAGVPPAPAQGRLSVVQQGRDRRLQAAPRPEVSRPATA